jgi:hypothetical protein
MADALLKKMDRIDLGSEKTFGKFSNKYKDDVLYRIR